MAFAVIIILILVGINGPPIVRALGKARLTQTNNNMKDLHKSLTMFAIDNNGSFPSEEFGGKKIDSKFQGARVLEQLVESGLIDEEKGLYTWLLSVPREAHGRWTYFSGLNNTDNSGLPLLISPKHGDEIVVLRIGGDVKYEPAENLSALLSSSTATPITIPATKR